MLAKEIHFHCQIIWKEVHMTDRKKWPQMKLLLHLRDVFFNWIFFRDSFICSSCLFLSLIGKEFPCWKEVKMAFKSDGKSEYRFLSLVSAQIVLRRKRDYESFDVQQFLVIRFVRPTVCHKTSFCDFISVLKIVKCLKGF